MQVAYSMVEDAYEIQSPFISARTKYRLVYLPELRVFPLSVVGQSETGGGRASQVHRERATYCVIFSYSRWYMIHPGGLLLSRIVTQGTVSAPTQ